MAVKTYQKKVVKIQAVQWTGENHPDLYELVDAESAHCLTALMKFDQFFYFGDTKNLYFRGLMDDVFVEVGNYIIKAGEIDFVICPQKVFHQVYEEV